MKISIIAAVADNYVIGIDNKLPWHLTSDLARFRETVKGHPIVFGRKTWEGLVEQGVKFPDSKIFVLSRSPRDLLEKYGCSVFISIDTIMQNATMLNYTELFIGGGEQVYKLTMSLTDTMYITDIVDHYEGDAYFPKINYDEWAITSSDFCYEDEVHKNKQIETRTRIFKRLSSKELKWIK